MKKLVLLLAVVLTIGLTTNVNAKNGFDKAIGICEKESPKKIQKKLCDGTSPTDLYNTQYTNVNDIIITELTDILDRYETFVKKNSKKDKKEKFEINVDNSKIKSIVKEYLNLHRNYKLLEMDSSKVNGIYTSITTTILKNHYYKNFKTGLVLALNSVTEDKVKKYTLFVKTTAIPKVDEDKMIVKMAEEYINEDIESNLKLFTCMEDAYKILKLFGDENPVSIKNDSKYKFIIKLKALLVNQSPGIAKDKRVPGVLQGEITKDILKHIKDSSVIQ